MNRYLSLTALSPGARPPDWPVALAPDHQRTVTWRNFLALLAGLRREIEKRPEPAWRLFAEDHILFLAGLMALLQSGRQVHLPDNLPSPDASQPGEPPLASDVAPHADIALVLAEADDQGPLADCPAVTPDRCRVFFHTSGSTGAPKTVEKSFLQVEAELTNLAGIWGDRFHGSTVFSTVSPQHFYGFLFAGLLPFCTGARLSCGRVHYPETLASAVSARSIIVTSPAFLKRADDPLRTGPLTQSPRLVFSSGGFLPESSAQKNRAWFGTDVTEIYGSTETGGIAWRRSPGDAPWTLFPGITLSATDQLNRDIISPYLPPPGRGVIEDRVEFETDGRFRLFGRTDSIVKIEEKRVALNDVENRLMETGLVADAVVAALESSRQFLAAALVLNDTGRKKFREASKIEMNRFFTDALRPYFHPVTIPRQWRFPESLPRNALGKITAEKRRALFEEHTAIAREPEMKVLEHSGDHAVLELVFPSTYVHFRGHFENMKILPAVAQMDWVMRYMSSLFQVPAVMSELPVFKLRKPIFPDTPVRLTLDLQRERRRLRFSFTDPSSQRLYSQGTVILERPV